MKSQRISLIDINHYKLQEDVHTISSFNFSDTYDDFVCGALKSCVLWNKNGFNNETAIINYRGAAKITPYGEALPYIQELVRNHFNLDYLRFARILMLTPNSVFIPHKDYLELKRDFLRFHIPLKTDKCCFNSEENIVYQMRLGEIWYIDATKVHSAASFSKSNRMHLILDFDYRESLSDVMRVAIDQPAEIPSSNIIDRPALTEKNISNIHSLHKLIDIRNFYDILGIIIKQYFKHNMHTETVFDWLIKICKRSKNLEIVKQAESLKEYCLLRRKAV